jgi:hypothetical protein
MLEQDLAFDVEVTPYKPPSSSFDFYREHGFKGDDETAAELLADASTFSGAAEQGWKFRLLQGEILTRWKERTPGFFDKWLELHWPQMGRATVARLMATWQHRADLTPFIDESSDFSHVRNALPINAIDTIAAGGAMPEVIEEVRQRLEQNIAVTPQVVADLNREAKAKRKGTAVPRKPQPVEAMALTIIRKDELDIRRQAVKLAERASVVTAADVMDEQNMRDLGKLRFIAGKNADFHRINESWIRLPHFDDIDAPTAKAIDPAPKHVVEQTTPDWNAAPLLTIEAAAIRLGMRKHCLSQSLTPGAAHKRKGAPLIRKGYIITREGHGRVRLTPVGSDD